MSENNNQSMGDLFPDLGPEVPIISGVAHDSTESLATVRRVPNEPGMAAKVFTMLAEAGVNVDMIVQASASTGTADISFTVPGTAAAKVQEVLQEKQGELGFQSFDVDPNVGKVAVVGVGMKTHSGLAAKFFNALSDKGVNVLMISTSEIRIAALVPLEQLNDAVKALHTAYGLDADQVEAVVYGGTGRWLQFPSIFKGHGFATVPFSFAFYDSRRTLHTVPSSPRTSKRPAPKSRPFAWLWLVYAAYGLATQAA